MNVRKLFRWILPKQKLKVEPKPDVELEFVEACPRDTTTKAILGHGIKSERADLGKIFDPTFETERNFSCETILAEAPTPRVIVEVPSVAESNRRARQRINEYQSGGSSSDFVPSRSSGGSDILVSAIPIAIVASIDSSPSSCSNSDSSSCD